MEELHGEMQTAMTSMVADFKKEFQAFRASEVAKDGELQACKAEVEAYKARIETVEAQLKVYMATMAHGGTVQVPAATKGNALRPSAFHGARNAREIDNFLCGLEAYLRGVGIEDDAQKVSNTTFSLKDVALVWWCRKCDNVRRGYDPINT